MSLIPINGNVLIELVEQYQHAATPDKEFATKTSGYCRTDISDPSSGKNLLDKRVWFESYKDDSKIERDGKTYSFIKWEDLKGLEVDE